MLHAELHVAEFILNRRYWHATHWNRHGAAQPAAPDVSSALPPVKAPAK
jgi:hypothetical protein